MQDLVKTAWSSLSRIQFPEVRLARTPPYLSRCPTPRSDKSGVPSKVTFGSLVKSRITAFRVGQGRERLTAEQVDRCDRTISCWRRRVDIGYVSVLFGNS